MNSFTLLTFHLDKSGKDIKELHLQKTDTIFSKFFVSQMDISGTDSKDSHPLNKAAIFETLLIFHFDRSGNCFNLLHP